MRNVPHMAAASLIVAKHHNTHCLAPNEEPAAYVDIPHFRVRNSGRAGIMEEFQGREGRLADRCSDRKTSLG